MEPIFEKAIPSLIVNIFHKQLMALKRLQTDYIDLYQLHWPERHTNFFGTPAYGNQQAQNDYDTTP